MYCKIITLFKSNIEGVYTKEIEIATDEQFLLIKQKRIIDRWFKIICPHIDINAQFDDVFNLTDSILDKEYFIFNYKLKCIKRTINELNYIDLMKMGKFQKREFSIKLIYEKEKLK